MDNTKVLSRLVADIEHGVGQKGNRGGTDTTEETTLHKKRSIFTFILQVSAMNLTW